MKSSLLILVLISFVLYCNGHASKNGQRLQSVLKKTRDITHVKETHKNSLDKNKTIKVQKEDLRLIKKQNSEDENNNRSIETKEKRLNTKLFGRKNDYSSRKRQNVFYTENPSEQRLFHVDETGTIHRHEVGPEEYSTPEGKTETFSSDKLLTEDHLSALRPSQASTMDASTRQSFSPPKVWTSSPVFQPGSPIAFVGRPFRPSTVIRPLARRYYFASSSTPNLQAPQMNEPVQSEKLRVFIHRLPYPRPQYFDTPFPPALPRTFPAQTVPVPYPVPSPPEIQRVPYPVPVPVQSPPQIHVQKVPVAVPQPIPVREVQKVPVPVPVQSPPQFRIQKVPVPVPQAVPVSQSLAMPQVYPHVHMRSGPIIPVPVGLSECEASPCRNGGTCYSVDDIQTYRCHCAEGYKGTHCEDTSKCHPNPCENFGECTVLQTGYECSCKKGFRGTRCEVRDQCHPTPCRNGGSCTSVATEYVCSCIYGFIGKNCEVESKCFPLNPCKHGGTCHENESSYKCNCSGGWAGISCEIPSYSTY